MKTNIIVTIPNLSAPGGVNFYWDAILPHLNELNTFNFETKEVGGYGKNIIAPFIDQWKFHNKVNASIGLVILNPSLGYKSFFRDALFAKQLAKKKKPFVVFFHGWDLNFEKKVTKKYTKFFQNTFGKAQKIIVLSNNFKKVLLQWGYKGEVIIETTAVDNTLLTNFSFDNHTKNNQRLRILFLSRLLKEKGIFETIEAFRKLEDDYKIELVIAGDGEAFDAVKEFTKNDQHIKMPGRVIGAEKINLFKSSDIYCLPSYSEGLPTTVLEAMAFGVPVITSEVGGLKDFFQDGKMGYFVAHQNSISLEKKLRLLLAQKDERAAMGAFNAAYVQEKLTGEKVAGRIHNYLENILK